MLIWIEHSSYRDGAIIHSYLIPMKKVLLLLLAVGFSGLQILLAQNVSVTGTVTTADDGEPLPGASIYLKGTSQGVLSDIDGHFSISVPATATLTFSFIGMQPQDVAVNSRKVINIAMKVEAYSLDEAMVVAYGTAKKASFTGSAGVVREKQLQSRTVASVTKAIEGTVAGVQTTSGGGQPGSGNAIRIRGFGSLYASSSPLYVVDGVPFDGNINSLNPNDVSSISILKDAAASSLYGARGANGVVMISTKKGTPGLGNVNFKATYGVSSRAFPNYERVNEKEYMELAYESRKNILQYRASNPLSAEEAATAALSTYWGGFGGETYNPYSLPSSELIDPTTGKMVPGAKLKWNDDWVKESTRKNPIRKEYQLSIVGGDERLKHLLSLGYLNEDGLAANSQFERFSGRINLDGQVKEWIKVGMSSSYAQTSQNYLTNSGTAYNNVWYSAMNMGPVYPVYQRNPSDGSLILDSEGKKQFDYGSNRPYMSNFSSIATLFADSRRIIYDNVNARAYADFQTKREDLGMLKDFKLSINYGMDLANGNRLIYQNPSFGDAAAEGGAGTKEGTRTLSYTLNQLLNWKHSFGDHNLDVLAGHEYYQMNYSYLGAGKTGYVFPGVTELDGAAVPTYASSYKDIYSVESYLSRINYDFQEKYFLSASMRSDGSSRFHKDNRWGTFWSVGGAWQISKESFMEDVEWVNQLTLKTSYGTQGNDMLLDPDGYDIYYAWQNLYSMEYPNNTLGGIWFNSIENKDLKWEKNQNFNIGFESQLFHRLNVGVEYFHKKTSDLLLFSPKASSLGFDGYWSNVGNMTNQGFDITLSGSVLQAEDFQWNMTLLMSTIKNKVTKLNTTADDQMIVNGSTVLKVGKPINSFYLPRSAGVDPETGKQLYLLTNPEEGGPTTTTDYNEGMANRFVLGSRIPDLYGSYSNEIRYKNFDLNLLLTYSIGGKMYDTSYATLMGQRDTGQAWHKDMLKRWQKPGDITDVPKLAIGTVIASNDNYLIDASYLSIKNISLGYNLPKAWVSKLNIEQLRVVFTADNLYTFTKLKGMDPQNNFTGTTGYSYVPIRTLSLGFDLKF